MSLGQDILDRYPDELSGGQRQRICLARVLLIKPSIIIFDESLSALDIINQKNTMDLILELQKEQGFSAVFISHDPSLIKYLCSNVIQIEDVQIINGGTVREVFEGK
jgi:peptide/nickel transport system ATP-binding protein